MRNSIDRYSVKGTRKYYHDEVRSLIKGGRLEQCEWCGASNYIIHHKDCDRHNNQADNLAFMCLSCHAKWHRLYPDYRYLHTHELKEIIKMCQKVLEKGIDITRIEVDTFTEKVITIEEKAISEIKEKESLDAALADYHAHPLPY
jgi:hypothetical protein